MIASSAAFPGWAADAPLEYQAYGTLVVTQFVSAPFPHPARALGHVYKDQQFPAAQHYSDNRVALFVPNGFRDGPKTHFVVHLHGWRATLERVLARFRLPEQFSASARNAILVVPQGPRDAPDSFGGKLEDPGGFARFMAEVQEVLIARKILATNDLGSIVLSAHSGGYHALAAILDRGGLADRVREVYLFDALYGQTASFSAWQRRFQGKLIDIYTADGGTRAETERFLAECRGQRLALFAGRESELVPAELRRQRLVFVFSDQDHNAVVFGRDNFRQCLEASELPARPPQDLDRPGRRKP